MWLSFPDGSASKESICLGGAAGDVGSDPGLRRFLKEEMATHSLEKSSGRRNLAGYSPWSYKKSDTTENSDKAL